ALAQLYRRHPRGKNFGGDTVRPEATSAERQTSFRRNKKCDLGGGFSRLVPRLRDGARAKASLRTYETKAKRRDRRNFLCGSKKRLRDICPGRRSRPPIRASSARGTESRHKNFSLSCHARRARIAPRHSSAFGRGTLTTAENGFDKFFEEFVGISAF